MPVILPGKDMLSEFRPIGFGFRDIIMSKEMMILKMQNTKLMLNVGKMLQIFGNCM